jgi:hypothetical protein
MSAFIVGAEVLARRAVRFISELTDRPRRTGF